MSQTHIAFERILTTMSTHFINLPPDEVDTSINRALRTVGELIGADRIDVSLFSADANAMDNVYEWCAEGAKPEIQRIESVLVSTFPWTSAALMHGEILQIPEVAELPPEASAEKQALQSLGIQSFISVPMVCRGSVIGSLRFNWGHAPSGEIWSEQSIALLRVLGEILVNAMEHRRTQEVLQAAYQALEQRVADRTRELSALHDVMAAASESLDLETVLERSLDRVLKVMGSEVGAIHLLDESGATLQLATLQGAASTVDSVLVDSGLAGWVIEQGEPLVVPTIADSPRPLLAVPAASTQAYVGVPVRARGRASGVLSVIGETGRQFNEAEVSLLVSIADQVGVAVENARLYRQAEHVAVVKERERLARELHDSVTQSLYSLTLLAEAGRRLAGLGDLQRVEEYLDRLGEISQQALKEMRLLVYELRPSVLRREGLAGALQQRLDAVEKRAGVDTRLLVEGDIQLAPSVEEGLYRIAQEALNNALKHAAATRVTVYIRGQGDHMELEVADNGTGFDPDAVDDKGGMGLTSMWERAEKLGGSLVILSTPGEGTRVTVGVEVSQ